MTQTEIQDFKRRAFDSRKRAEDILKSVTDEKPLTEAQSSEVDALLDRAEDEDKNRKRAEKIFAAEKAAAESAPEKDAPKRGKQLTKDDLQRRAFTNYIRTGERTYQTRDDQVASLDTVGGYVMAPPVVLSEVLKEVDDTQYIRRITRRLPSVPPNGTLGVPFSNNNTLNAAWASELTTADPSNVEFGGREFKPNYLTYKTFFSWSLIDGAVINVESFVRGEMAIIAGEVMEKAYMTGTGVGQPLGLFTASDDGLPASRDVETAGAAIAFEDVIDTFYSLKDQYMRNATWFMNRMAFKQIVKLKGTDGHPIFRTGLAPGDPMTVEGRPVIMSEFAPTGSNNGAYQTGDYLLAVGDFMKYWVCDSTMMRVIRQVETHADQNLLAIVTRQQTDGAPVLSEAFTRLKLK